MKYIHKTVFSVVKIIFFFICKVINLWNYVTDMSETLLFSTIRNKNPHITDLFWPEQIQDRSEKSQTPCSKLVIVKNRCRYLSTKK